MMEMSRSVAGSASTAYVFCKDMFLYAKGHKRDIERVKQRMSKIINLLISIKLEKEIIDQSLRNSSSMEPSQSYTVMEAEIAVIGNKCIKLIGKYMKITNNRPGSTTKLDASTASFMIDKLRDLTSKIVKLNALKLIELNRDVLKLSMRASKVLDALMRPGNMIQKTSVTNQEKVYDDSNVLPVFNTYVDEVLQYLFEEDGKRVGILGCQGAGKTTVMRKLYDRLLQQESLDYIIFIEYPQQTETTDVNKIVEDLQKEIMIQLNIDHEVSISTHKNARIISTFLRNKKYVLLIDHVSGAIDLENQGFKVGHMHKVVVCSRDRNVLLRMTEVYVEIQGLETHEALKLFKNICGNLLLDHQKTSIAERIIELCGGIPGIIREVAIYLKDKKDLESWYHVKRILQSNSRSVKLLGIDGFDKAYEMSYDGLETNAKKCLLYAALFPHGYKIQSDHLIECWIAEGFIAMDGKQKVRINRGYGRYILNHLIDRHLLQWYPGKECVMMQPNFRRVALELIYSGKEKCEIWMPSERLDCDEETWTTVTRVSMISCNTILPERPSCPNMHTLLLQSMQAYSINLPESFFNHMESLKVLNLNNTKIEALPESIRYLTNLKSLYLNGCLHLDDLPPEASYLCKLEFLDICGTSVITLPRVISSMHDMRCLRASLSSLDEEAIIPPGIISSLEYLEELSLITTIAFGDVVAERLAKELASLEYLNTLCINFPKVNSLNTFVTHSKALKNKETSWGTHTFRSFRISIGFHKTQHPYESDMESVNERWFRFSINEEFSAFCQEILNQANGFELIGHSNLKSFKCSQFDLHQVKILVVESCKDLMNIMDGYITNEEQDYSNVSLLHNMEKLYLYDLESLKCIWYGPVPPTALANLTAITINGCPKLTRILDPILALSLQSLEYLKVENCSQISRIIEETDETFDIVEESRSNSNLLRSLKKLELSNLQELESICETSSISWNSLKSIIVIKCNKLRNLSLSLTNARKLASIQCEENWWDTISFPEEVRQRLLPVCCFKDESIEEGSQFERSDWNRLWDEITQNITSVDPPAPSNKTGKLSMQASEAVDELEFGEDIMHIKSESAQEKFNDDNNEDLINIGPIDLECEILHPSATLSNEDMINIGPVNLEHEILGPSATLSNEDVINIGPVNLEHEILRPNATLSLVDQDLHELEMSDHVYHDLLVLHLQGNRRLTLIHSSYFDAMPYLHFLDISNTKIRTLPASLFNIPKLKVLLLRNCICLEGVPPEIGKLNYLETLDLSGAELYDLPDEIGTLVSITSMHLSFYGPDDESEYEHVPSRLVCSNFLAHLNHIQTLSVSVHPKDRRWNEIATDIIEDMSKLEDLIDLEFYFPKVEMFEDFIQLSLSWEKMRMVNFNFIVGQNVKRIISRVPDEVEQLFSQQERCLRYVNGDKVPPLLGSVLLHVTSFYLDHHTQVRSLSDFNIRAFDELKFCVVRECPKMEAILDDQIEFPSLEYLGIFYLWELKNIWKSPSRSETPMPSRNFEALKYLTVKTCHKIRFVLGESMLHCLANLEELVVQDCAAVEKIIEEEKEEDEYKTSVQFPRLRKVVLDYLPELVSLGCGVRLSEGTVMSVCDCPKYARIDTRKAEDSITLGSHSQMKEAGHKT